MNWLASLKSVQHRYARSGLWALLIFLAIYLAIHVLALTKLPVFADEAIYIRWAQLIMDEPTRYLFFALNDGKTPLLIWIFVPLQYLFKDPLAAGRIVSVLAGLVQILLTGKLIKKLGGDKLAAVTGSVLTAILPFWFFLRPDGLNGHFADFVVKFGVVGHFISAPN